MALSYGHLYVDGGSTLQTITCGTPAVMTGFATAGECSTQFGETSITVVAASDKITCKKGIYLVTFNCSGYTDVTSDLADIIAKLYTDNATAASFAAAAGFSARASFGEADAYAHLGFRGIFEVTAASADLKVYVDAAFAATDSSETTIDFTPVHAQLVVIKLSS